MQMLFANEYFDKIVNLAVQAGVRYSIENPYAYVKSNYRWFPEFIRGLPSLSDETTKQYALFRQWRGVATYYR